MFPLFYDLGNPNEIRNYVSYNKKKENYRLMPFRQPIDSVYFFYLIVMHLGQEKTEEIFMKKERTLRRGFLILLSS